MFSKSFLLKNCRYRINILSLPCVFKNRIMNKKQSTLKVDSILEYYDNPQLLTARDCFDTLYLCLLYEDTPECKYTAIY